MSAGARNDEPWPASPWPGGGVVPAFGAGDAVEGVFVGMV